MIAYVATPYTKYPSGLTQAFKDAAIVSAKLLLKGIIPYSPIAHTHPIAIFGRIDPLDHGLWLEFDKAMLTAASSLIVVHMQGWEDSKGIAHEVEFFERSGKPIYDLDPETMELTLRGKG